MFLLVPRIRGENKTVALGHTAHTDKLAGPEHNSIFPPVITSSLSPSHNTDWQNIKILTVHIDGGGGLHDPGLWDGSVPDGAAVGGVVVLLPGHDGQHGLGGLRPGGGREVEGLQVGFLSVLVPEYLWRGRAAHTGAGEVERFPLGDRGLERLHPGRTGGQQHHQLDHAGVQFVAAPELHLPTLEVAVVPVVGRVLDPQVVPPKVGLMIHTENKEMFQNSVFPTVATVPMIKHQRVDRLK